MKVDPGLKEKGVELLHYKYVHEWVNGYYAEIARKLPGFENDIVAQYNPIQGYIHLFLYKNISLANQLTLNDFGWLIKIFLSLNQNRLVACTIYE